MLNVSVIISTLPLIFPLIILKSLIVLNCFIAYLCTRLDRVFYCIDDFAFGFEKASSKERKATEQKNSPTSEHHSSSSSDPFI